ncbi:unnamed protein product, partial [marine sediment metagenome]
MRHFSPTKSMSTTFLRCGLAIALFVAFSASLPGCGASKYPPVHKSDVEAEELPETLKNALREINKYGSDLSKFFLSTTSVDGDSIEVLYKDKSDWRRPQWKLRTSDDGG